MSIALGSDGEPLIAGDVALLEEEILMGVHLGISCDVCGIENIEGPRYHCRECFDFDLCGRCHQNCCTIHPYHSFDLIDAPMVPIRQSDLRSDPVPWLRFTMENLLSELDGTSLGVDDALVTEWLSEDRQRIDKEDVAQQGEVWVCTICMEGVEVDVNGSLVKICADAGRAHIFHTGCLHSWLTKSNTCPICRRSDIIDTSHESEEDEVMYYC